MSVTRVRVKESRSQMHQREQRGMRQRVQDKSMYSSVSKKRLALYLAQTETASTMTARQAERELRKALQSL